MPKTVVLILCLLLSLGGCNYGPSGIDDFHVICPSCSVGAFDKKRTTIRCRADSVLSTACHTPCRHCGRMLAEPGDNVWRTHLSGGVHVVKRGHPQ